MEGMSTKTSLLSSFQSFELATLGAGRSKQCFRHSTSPSNALKLYKKGKKKEKKKKKKRRKAGSRKDKLLNLYVTLLVYEAHHRLPVNHLGEEKK
jgi:hypothetical protein